MARLPKKEYFYKRFNSAWEKNRFNKAAYYKARFENESGMYLSCGMDDILGYQNYAVLDKYKSYQEAKAWKN